MCMPYIITTINPKGATDQDADGHSFYVPTSDCVAVATLEETRRAEPVIEVEQVSWNELRIYAGVDPLTARRIGDQAIIDAFNAR